MAAPVRIAVSTVVGHQKPSEAITSTLRQGVGSAVGASLAHRIGQLYRGDDKIGYVNHKLLHFISGGITGSITNNDPIGGALGAAFAEVAMEGCCDAQKEAQSILAENPDISREDFNELIRERMASRRMFSSIIGGFAGALGGAFGAAMAGVSHTDARLGALSGAFGAMTSEMIAEGFNPEATDIEMYQLANPSESREQVVEHFMESARKTASWSAFTSAAAAFGVGLDPSIAHTTATNAVNNNNILVTVPLFLIACTAMTPEYHNFFINMREEGIEVALKKLGIGLVDTATVALAVETGIGALPYAFEVGGIVVKNLQEALAIVARSPGLSGEAKQLHTAMQANLPKVEGMVVEKSINNIVDKSTANLGGLTGEYRYVKGHHVHAKKAFEGHVNYDPKKGFSISEEFMKLRDIKHSRITGVQHVKFNKLAISGRPNTIYEHTRIAVESLTEVGISVTEARNLVAESLIGLRAMGVRAPTRLPWNS